MKIGIVTTWFERGAAYVSKIYKELLEKEGHEVYIYARGGENISSQNEPKWNQSYVTRDNTYTDLKVNKNIFFRWIKKNGIDAVLFNEQQHFKIVAQTKKRFPNVKIGAYVDYYTESVLPWFNMYDFVICNTKRHMQAMEKHPQKFYVRWGTDVNLYKPLDNKKEKLTFFHSAGMSTRKGTDLLIEAFIEGKCYKKSSLIIHTQLPIKSLCKYSLDELNGFGISVIEKTVTAPGLYYLGDIYVYPTRLDGLGLTMYEALSSGLPVITTDFPPMNEAVNNDVGRLVKVEDFYCRGDAYYYPMAICSKDSLIESLNWYIEHPEQVCKQKVAAREYALANYDISVRSAEVSQVFEYATIREFDSSLYNNIMKYYGWRNSNFICYLRTSARLNTLIKTFFNK